MRLLIVFITLAAASILTAAGRSEPAFALAIQDSPEILRAIRTADEVCIFPVRKPVTPHRNDKHLRVLDAEARRKVCRLLGDERSWFHGVYTVPVIDDGSRGIGL